MVPARALYLAWELLEPAPCTIFWQFPDGASVRYVLDLFVVKVEREKEGMIDFSFDTLRWDFLTRLHNVIYRLLPQYQNYAPKISLRGILVDLIRTLSV